ncbi:hypothetical protein Klosneuvirus_1_7 [Klosneuvirus KNV1]|uniref:BTB domain-containing protein n=1 Tax=Klosneuvirus KNV1 TaxID=1977640 RepID=A0A1V0SHE7_9VIRU|nr:hypothetical protein Klosneuvirus_1_7 [Klosneuvirus KNV1]
MLTTLRTLYNQGDNDGNVIIKTTDHELICHDFVLKYTSDFFKNYIIMTGFDGIITLDYDSKLVNIVFNCMYSEKVIEQNLTGQEIIKLYALLDQLKCKNIEMIIKNHYLKKFPSTLTENNWMTFLRMVFNVEKYIELQKEILNYFANHILMNLETVNMYLFSDIYKDTDSDIKDTLFKICLEKIMSLTTELKTNMENEELKKKMNEYLKTDDEESDEEPKKVIPKKKK